MRRVDGAADIKINIGCIVKQHARNLRSAVALRMPGRLKLAAGGIILNIFKHAVYRKNTLCYKVNAIDFRGGRNFVVKIVD